PPRRPVDPGGGDRQPGLGRTDLRPDRGLATLHRRAAADRPAAVVGRPVAAPVEPARLPPHGRLSPGIGRGNQPARPAGPGRRRTAPRSEDAAWPEAT